MDLGSSSGQPRDINSRRRATRRSACTRETVSSRRATFRSLPRILDCRDYLSWTSVKHHHVSQYWWKDTQRVLTQQNRVRACEWCVSTAGGHVGNAETWEQWHQNADGIGTRQSDEAQPAKLGNVPVLPSEAEVEEHELTHLLFTSWCRHCVRVKSNVSPHPESSPGGVSKFATDYMFMCKEWNAITMLAGYDGLTNTFLSNVVPLQRHES